MILELSDRPSTAKQLKCSQAQKRSKDIGTIVHVKVAQLQFFCFPLNVISVVNVQVKAHACVLVFSKIAEDGNSEKRIVK